MAGPAPPPYAGRLVLIWFGLATVTIILWLVLKARPEQEPEPVVRVEPEPPEQPIGVYLARGDASRGEAYFMRCAGCHTINAGGPHGVGPNLTGVMGNPIASRPDYAYSPALGAVGGRWDWETTSRFLRNPRRFAPGTRMTFAGIGNPQDRADVMLYLNRQGGRLPWPQATQ